MLLSLSSRFNVQLFALFLSVNIKPIACNMLLVPCFTKPMCEYSVLPLPPWLNTYSLLLLVNHNVNNSLFPVRLLVYKLLISLNNSLWNKLWFMIIAGDSPTHRKVLSCWLLFYYLLPWLCIMHSALIKGEAQLNTLHLLLNTYTAISCSFSHTFTIARVSRWQ